MLSDDEYIALLQERQAAWEANRPPALRSWVRPLLEWFIEPGDELLFTPPPVQPQPKRVPQPRRYRPSSEIRAERDRVQAELDRATTPVDYDPGVVNLSPSSRSRAAANAGRRRMQQLDNHIATVARLTRRRDELNTRLARAEYREHKQQKAEKQ